MRGKFGIDDILKFAYRVGVVIRYGIDLGWRDYTQIRQVQLYCTD